MTDTDTGVVALLVRLGSSWWSAFEAALFAHSGRVLGSLITVALALIAGRLSARWLLAGLKRWALRTHTQLDDIILKHLARPVRLLLPLLMLMSVRPFLELRDTTHTVLRQLLMVAVILEFGWIGIKIVRIVSEVVAQRLQASGSDTIEARSGHTQLQGFRNIAVFLIAVVTAGLALLSVAGVRQIGASLLASAGVAGIVLGIAAQRTIATVIAGITIALAQPIRIRDVVVVEGQFGTVEEITLTYVVVRAWDLRRMVLPIQHFLETPFENWTRATGNILATVLLYVDYSLPVDRLREELKRILDASADWDRTQWRLDVSDATERTMVVRPLMSAANSDAAWRLRCEVREKLIGFLQREYPGALPHVRAELTPLPSREKAPTS
ncbi:MAG TPA: mechanosensitive ion channel domain-containing protein [Polyangiaceae bacterium]|nr:mechanosensitive ion channel domain-containing protein [Polyangiaceae bacterium]